MEQEFKQKVLAWLKENKIDIGNKKVRVYHSPRYGTEVRIYNEPMEITNSKKSRRKMDLDENGNNCMVGIFSRKFSTYTHIGEDDFKNPEELSFILDTIRNN